MSKWNKSAKQLLKAELMRRGISTEDLVVLLNQNGCTETKSSVDSKISRGTFSASFLIQCLYVIGCTRIDLEGFRAHFFIQPTSMMIADSNIDYKTSNDED